MTTPRVRPLTLLAILLMACMAGLGSNASATDPILHFPDGITWKGVFDAGFRPKHVSGLKIDSCRISDQSFQLQFKEKPELFSLDRGLLTFQLKADNGVRQIWHQGGVPISMEEGRRRLEQFERMVEGYIFQKGRLPILLDKATASVQTEREFDSIAHVDGYIINYGFNSSFVENSPLIPRLYITWRGFSPAELLRKEEVAPPEGYEWYSLDPKIDTPAPGIRRPMSEAEPPAVVERPRPGAQKKRSETQEAADKSGFNPLWLIAVLGGILIVAAVAIIRCLRKA